VRGYNNRGCRFAGSRRIEGNISTDEELMTDDKSLIEDYLPIVAISAEASREKSVRKGHISTLHLWWARRPLVACRAAVYGALVPASQFVPNGGSDAQKKSLGRANAAKFVKQLCQYPSESKPEEKAAIDRAIKEAQHHVLKAHAERLTLETGKTVTVEDILAGRAPRPRVLDLFAGGGAIPLEASRLGCESFANDLNPVAHIIQLCTLVYPQKFGKPDATARGMTGHKNEKGEATWGGLADEVRYWGNWVLEKVRAEIGDLYPLIPDPEFTPPKKRKGANAEDEFAEPQHVMGFADDPQQRLKTRTGHLMPVAYLWTLTVKCKNPNCGATVPLVKQTWLCKKSERYVALKIIAPKGQKFVRFEVVEARTEQGLGFDPAAGSKGGSAACPFCNAVADSDYVKEQGMTGRIAQQFMAVATTKSGVSGKIYLSLEQLPSGFLVSDEVVAKRLADLQKREAMPVLDEPIEINPRSMDIDKAGFTTWGQIFTTRQQLSLTNFCAQSKAAEREMVKFGISTERCTATATMLACGVSKLADFSSTLCMFNYTGGRGVKNSFPQQSLPMVWDFAETNPFNPDGASWIAIMEDNPAVIDSLSEISQVAKVQRGSAIATPWPDGFMDAVITDPPYYDNVSYSNLSDFFHVWLKRSVGHLYPEHFATVASPKKAEIIAASYRHGGQRQKAKTFYEEGMGKAFAEAHRLLKPTGELAVVYAHKTTLGWSTLVDALRKSGFVVTEAWPLDTERKGRVIAMDTAALASSIFLVARKRVGNETGYEDQVRPELESIVRERVETLWDMGISGADLVIASVGAGLRAFTRFARVEYANGEEVPAERFLTEVETVVLETILTRLSKEVGGNGGQYSLASLDTASRFYVLWRYTYGAAELDAGEAIIFANGTHVELDGQHGLAGGNHAMIEKKKSKYRLRDYAERGENDNLGLPGENGQAAPLVDMLHRTLWLMEKRPAELAAFLSEAQPNREQLRLVAQALGGPALKGGELGDISPTAELSALGKLTANWQSLIEDAALTTGEREEKKVGQKQLI
jgi:putative DNA methylase